MFMLEGGQFSVLQCFLQIRFVNTGCVPAVVSVILTSLLTKIGFSPLLLLLLGNSSITPSPGKGDLLSRMQLDTVTEKSTKNLGQKGLRMRQLDLTYNHR